MQDVQILILTGWSLQFGSTSDARLSHKSMRSSVVLSLQGGQKGKAKIGMGSLGESRPARPTIHWGFARIPEADRQVSQRESQSIVSVCTRWAAAPGIIRNSLAENRGRLCVLELIITGARHGVNHVFGDSAPTYHAA